MMQELFLMGPHENDKVYRILRLLLVLVLTSAALAEVCIGETDGLAPNSSKNHNLIHDKLVMLGVRDEKPSLAPSTIPLTFPAYRAPASTHSKSSEPARCSMISGVFLALGMAYLVI